MREALPKFCMVSRSMARFSDTARRSCSLVWPKLSIVLLSRSLSASDPVTRFRLSASWVTDSTTEPNCPITSSSPGS